MGRARVVGLVVVHNLSLQVVHQENKGILFLEDVEIYGNLDAEKQKGVGVKFSGVNYDVFI